MLIRSLAADWRVVIHIGGGGVNHRCKNDDNGHITLRRDAAKFFFDNIDSFIH